MGKALSPRIKYYQSKSRSLTALVENLRIVEWCEKPEITINPAALDLPYLDATSWQEKILLLARYADSFVPLTAWDRKSASDRRRYYEEITQHARALQAAITPPAGQGDPLAAWWQVLPLGIGPDVFIECLRNIEAYFANPRITLGRAKRPTNEQAANALIAARWIFGNILKDFEGITSKPVSLVCDVLQVMHFHIDEEAIRKALDT